jgi:hypothetical protein
LRADEEPKSIQALDAGYVPDLKGRKMVLQERIEFGSFSWFWLIYKGNLRSKSRPV